MSKLFVGNVPYRCSVDEFESVFKNEPGFVSAELQSDSAKNTRGFGFVEFVDTDSSDPVLQKEFRIGGRVLRLSEYRNRNRKLFIRDLNGVSLKQFEGFFSRFGILTKSYIVTDRQTGVSKGIGVVEYETEQGYREALNCENPMIGETKITIQPYKEKSTDTRPVKPDAPNSYINGYNSGYSAGFSSGFKEGYKTGFEDAKTGKMSDYVSSYLSKIMVPKQSLDE